MDDELRELFREARKGTLNMRGSKPSAVYNIEEFNDYECAQCYLTEFELYRSVNKICIQCKACGHKEFIKREGVE